MLKVEWGAAPAYVGTDGQRQLCFTNLEPHLDDQPVESTVYSLAESPPQPPERRSGERYLSLLRVGSLMIGDRRELCLIRNISAGGMMIRAYSTIPLGTTLSVELKQGDPATGTAQWNDDGLTGVTFDKPIDVLDLLAPPGEGPRPRMPRIALECIAWVREGAHIRRTRAINISQGGLCVQSPVELTLDADVIVTLTGLAPLPGLVKWKDGDNYGIGFNRVLRLEDLVKWLQGSSRTAARSLSNQSPERTTVAAVPQLSSSLRSAADSCRLLKPGRRKSGCTRA